MPILIAVRLPKRQKIILLLLFGLGLFEIIAALLTKIYCLVPSLISYEYMNWYFREATIAMLVTNIPLAWSLVRDMFPGLKRWINDYSDDYEPPSWPKNTSSDRRSRLSKELALQIMKDTTMSREHMIPSVHPSQTLDVDLETGGKRTILVHNDVILEVENAKGSRRNYPVRDWIGDHDHISATDVVGGRVGAAK